jgi:hypothetical protein
MSIFFSLKKLPTEGLKKLKSEVKFVTKPQIPSCLFMAFWNIDPSMVGGED